MPSVTDFVAQFEADITTVPHRTPYAEAVPRTRSRQLVLVARLAACVLQAPGLTVTPGPAGHLLLRLPTCVPPGVMWTAEELHAVQLGCCCYKGQRPPRALFF